MCAFAADNGADLYDQECADCHSLAKPPKNKKGPSLVGIMGKPAAAVPNFAYSEALKAAQIVWTPDKMDAYVKNPKELVPGGGKMKYDGLANAAERAAIIEFLNQQK
jgi:cytochrome c